MKTFGFLILVFVELLYISPGFSESLHDPEPGVESAIDPAGEPPAAFLPADISISPAKEARVTPPSSSQPAASVKLTREQLIVRLEKLGFSFTLNENIDLGKSLNNRGDLIHPESEPSQLLDQLEPGLAASTLSKFLRKDVNRALCSWLEDKYNLSEIRERNARLLRGAKYSNNVKADINQYWGYDLTKPPEKADFGESFNSDEENKKRRKLHALAKDYIYKVRLSFGQFPENDREFDPNKEYGLEGAVAPDGNNSTTLKQLSLEAGEKLKETILAYAENDVGYTYFEYVPPEFRDLISVVFEINLALKRWGPGPWINELKSSKAAILNFIKENIVFENYDDTLTRRRGGWDKDEKEKYCAEAENDASSKSEASPTRDQVASALHEITSGKDTFRDASPERLSQLYQALSEGLSHRNSYGIDDKMRFEVKSSLRDIKNELLRRLDTQLLRSQGILSDDQFLEKPLHEMSESEIISGLMGGKVTSEKLSRVSVAALAAFSQKIPGITKDPEALNATLKQLDQLRDHFHAGVAGKLAAEIPGTAYSSGHFSFPSEITVAQATRAKELLNDLTPQLGEALSSSQRTRAVDFLGQWVFLPPDDTGKIKVMSKSEYEEQVKELVSNFNKLVVEEYEHIKQIGQGAWWGSFLKGCVTLGGTIADRRTTFVQKQECRFENQDSIAYKLKTLGVPERLLEGLAEVVAQVKDSQDAAWSQATTQAMITAAMVVGAAAAIYMAPAAALLGAGFGAGSNLLIQTGRMVDGKSFDGQELLQATAAGAMLGPVFGKVMSATPTLGYVLVGGLTVNDAAHAVSSFQKGNTGEGTAELLNIPLNFLLPELFKARGTAPHVEPSTSRKTPRMDEHFLDFFNDSPGSVPGSTSALPHSPTPGLPSPSSPRAPLPRTQGERHEVTRRAVESHLPSADPALVRDIEQIVENVGHHNRSGVVVHGEATPEQLRARTQDLREALIRRGVPRDTAEKITSDVIRGGAAGLPATSLPSGRDPSRGTVRTPPEGVVPYEINLNRMGARVKNSETAPFTASAEAKREAKWQVGIAKDQAPVFVFENPVYKDGKLLKTIVQEFYEVDFGPGIGKIHVVLMEHSAGDGHALPHWEVGIPKSDVTGRIEIGSGGERAGAYVYHNENKLRIFFGKK